MKKQPKGFFSRLLEEERVRQTETIDLIASENAASSAVRDANASVFMNKYAEGYPGARYYPGNDVADRLESRVRRQAQALFKAPPAQWRVNVQPYSGTPANIAVYVALLEFGDTLMGLALSQGGHLTHGHRVNFSGKAYTVISYGLNNKSGEIDYEALEVSAKSHKPKLIVSGATAYSRKIDFARIGKIARRVGAIHMADISHIAGLVAAGLHPSPFPWADVVTTTTHKTLRGPRGAMIFSRKQFSEQIDRAVFPGMQGGPHLNTIAALGVALDEARRPAFVVYQRHVIQNARSLADALKKYGFTIITGGTDNHLFLVDVRNKGLNGAEAEQILERAGIIANRNTIPGDMSARVPSGVRFGTPFVTTRGMGDAEMKTIAQWIYELLDRKISPEKIRQKVKAMARQYLLP